MTIFTTDLFRLNLSHLNIKFSEENSFFEKDIIKQQSFPFKVPRERSFLSFFDFIESHNSTESNKYVKGILFINDKFYDAELMVIRIAKEIEAVFYYKADNLTIFDKNLRDLPWGTIDVGDSIFDYAKQTIAKDYPETKVNFPRIYAPELYKDYDFGSHTGYINEVVGGDFSDILPNPFNLPLRFYKMNEIRPFMYLREILKGIFDEIGYTLSGDFITNASLEKCLLYNQTSVFYTNEDTSKSDSLNLSLTQSNVLSGSAVTHNEYSENIEMTSYGSFAAKINIQGVLPNVNGGLFRVTCLFNNVTKQVQTINSSTDNTEINFNRTLEFEFDVDKNQIGSYLQIKVVCIASVKPTIKGDYELNGTKRPLYGNIISKSDLLPDISVGSFIIALEKSINIGSVFDPLSKNVNFSLFNTFIASKPSLDLSGYGQTLVPRKLNKSIGYKISFADDEVLYFNKEGNYIESATDFKKYSIPIEPLKTSYINGVPNVSHQEGLSMLFFKANTNANPLVIDAGVSYSRKGFIDLFLKNWMFQKLNSEEYNLTINLPLYLSCQLDLERKLWIYNNNFLIHSLKRVNINSLFEKINLKLFKLNNKVSAVQTFLPPVIKTSSASNVSGQLPHETSFSTSVNPSILTNPPYVLIKIYANGSTDPQGLDLSYGWELISSPTSSPTPSLSSENSDDSILVFTNTGLFNLDGDYVVRITVTNSEGLSSTEDLTLTVTDNTSNPPVNRIVLAKLNIAEFLAPSGKFTISFVDISPTSVQMSLQKIVLGTGIPIGAPIISTITNFTLAHHEIAFPTSGSWRISATAGVETSNSLDWTRFF